MQRHRENGFPSHRGSDPRFAVCAKPRKAATSPGLGGGGGAGTVQFLLFQERYLFSGGIILNIQYFLRSKISVVMLMKMIVCLPFWGTHRSLRAHITNLPHPKQPCSEGNQGQRRSGIPKSPGGTRQCHVLNPSPLNSMSCFLINMAFASIVLM